jgi:hypothetical protein
MPCDEWCRLAEHYRTAVNTYNEAVKALGVLPGTEFNKMWPRTERARTKCDRRRADLLHHEHDHACLDGGQPNNHKQLSGRNRENLVLGHQGKLGC